MSKSNNTKKEEQSVENHDINTIISDLYQYALDNPTVVKETKRILDPSRGPEVVNHIPIYDIITILDEVVMQRHNGSWEISNKTMELKMDNVIISIDVTIFDSEGNSSTRIGIGASHVRSGTGRTFSSDSVDNATKKALASAIKKAASFFGVGISMWKTDIHEDDDNVSTIIENKESPSMIDGGATVHNSSNNKKKNGKQQKLPDKLAKMIYTRKSKYGLTDSDILNIMENDELTKESNGDSNWLMQGDQKDKVTKLAKAIDKAVGRIIENEETQNAK